MRHLHVVTTRDQVTDGAKFYESKWEKKIIRDTNAMIQLVTMLFPFLVVAVHALQQRCASGRERHLGLEPGGQPAMADGSADDEAADGPFRRMRGSNHLIPSSSWPAGAAGGWNDEAEAAAGTDSCAGGPGQLRCHRGVRR